MCGIAGYVAFDRRLENLPDLEQMTRLLSHRGPDDEGFYREPGVGLGMRRLAIIDLEAGAQPMTNETGDVQVVYNGEIYNHQELRSVLEASGHDFATNCDTEVLVHGWEEWGPSLVERLRGMFAFAIWDRRTRRIFLGRDHFGIKPLYYARVDGLLLFASEIKSLLVYAKISREIDIRSLDRFLSFLYVPEPETIFSAVRALPPGHTLTMSEDEESETRYWRFRPADRFSDRAEALVALRAVFEDSVRVMLAADVPVGLFLSGGVDSASILAMMARHQDQPVRSFSIGFGAAEHRWNELGEARALAREFGAKHHEFRLDPDVISTLPEVIRGFDQPFANPTAVILSLLAKETRDHVKVALTGAGGDEFFGGYPRYLGMRLSKHYRRIPRSLRRAAAGIGQRLISEASDGQTTGRRLRRFLVSGALPFEASYSSMLMTIEEDRKRDLYSEKMRQNLGDSETLSFIHGHLDLAENDYFAREDLLLATDIATYLPFNQLAYADRMSMAHSLEVRVPFVDQRLAEVAAAIPFHWNLRRGETKSLFREAMSPFVPPDVLSRSKRGLNLPIALWFRGDLLPWLRGLISSERIERRGYFRPAAVEGVLDEHLSGRRDHSLFLWALAVLELWHEAYVDG